MPNYNRVAREIQPRSNISYYTVVVMNQTGEFLKNRRKELRLTQSEVATRAGISVSYLSTLERGQRHSITNAELTPDRSKVVALAKALKTDRDELLVMFGFAPENPLEHKKPETVAELLSILTSMGVENPIFKDGIENLPNDPDVLEDILRVISMTVEIELRKHPNNAPQISRGSILHE